MAVILVGTFAFAKIIMEKNAKNRLGGDIEVSRIGLPGALSLQAYLGIHGKVRSESKSVKIEAKAHAKDAAGEIKPVTAIIKSIDRKYPLYSKWEFTDKKRRNIFGHFAKGTIRGAVVTKSLLSELGIEVGEHFLIGDKMFVATAILTKEPDAPSDDNAPRMLVSTKGFFEMLNVNRQYDHKVIYSYRIKLPNNADTAEWKTNFKNVFGGDNWQVRSWQEMRPPLSPAQNGLLFLLLFWP